MNLKVRLTSLLFYIGLSPFFPFLLFKKNFNNQIRSEYRTALSVLFFVNLSFILNTIIIIIVLPSIATFSPKSLEKMLIGDQLFLIYISGFLLLIGIIIWFICLLRIIIGFNFKFPFIEKISYNYKLLTLTHVFNLLKLLFVIFFIFSTYQSNKISKTVNENPKVYILYDDEDYIPKWIFTFASYRIFIEANEKWEQGEVAVLPLTTETLKTAFNKARMFIFLGHGGYGPGGTIYMRKENYLFFPQYVQKIGVGSNLKYTFFGSCRTGMLEKQWKKVLYPANVKAFNRLVLTISDDLYWCWFKLPGILKKI